LKTYGETHFYSAFIQQELIQSTRSAWAPVFDEMVFRNYRLALVYCESRFWSLLSYSDYLPSDEKAWRHQWIALYTW